MYAKCITQVPHRSAASRKKKVGFSAGQHDPAMSIRIMHWVMGEEQKTEYACAHGTVQVLSCIALQDRHTQSEFQQLGLVRATTSKHERGGGQTEYAQAHGIIESLYGVELDSGDVRRPGTSKKEEAGRETRRAESLGRGETRTIESCKESFSWILQDISNLSAGILGERERQETG